MKRPDINSLLLKVEASNEVKEKKIESQNSKRGYRELADVLFSEDPEFEIHEEDTYLLKVLKETLCSGGYRYSDFLGQEKIVYSTFYAMKNTRRLNIDIFERFMRVAGLEYTINVMEVGGPDGD